MRKYSRLRFHSPPTRGKARMGKGNYYDAEMRQEPAKAPP
ncbi:unnamed protein product [Ixodes pacificus]